MVSVVDLLPTIMDALGVKKPARLDGRSFYPVLAGNKQEKRNFVIKEYNENAGGSRDPMRAIQSKEYLYLFNPWSNGSRVFATATNGTRTCKRMIELAKTDKDMAARLDIYKHRVPAELYQVNKDPDCLVNLIDHPEHQKELQRLQRNLQQWMVRTKDPILEVFQKREDKKFVEEYMLTLEAQAEARKKAKNKSPKSKNKKKS